MKTFTFSTTGILPEIIKITVDKFDGKPASRDSILALDDEIRFLVCDIGDFHGNLNKHAKDAWICPRTAGSEGGDNSWNVSIKF